MSYSMTGIAFVDGDYQNHTSWFNQLDTNLQNMKGLDAGQTEVEAEAPVFSSEFLLELNASLEEGRLVHDQTAHRSDFALVAEKTDGTLSNGDFCRLSLVLGDNAEESPAYEELFRFWAERISSTAGNFYFDPLKNGSALATSPITLDGANQRAGVKRESPSYALDVGGKVKADEYREAGSALSSLWAVGEDKLTHTGGDGRVTGSLIASGENPFRSENSTTKVNNLNLPTLEGHAWPDFVVDHNLITPVTLTDPQTDYVVFTLTFSEGSGHRNGWYFIDANVRLVIDTGDTSEFFYLESPNSRSVKSSTVIGDIPSVPIIDLVEVTGLESEDQTVEITMRKIDSRMVGSSTVTGYAYARWCCPPTS